MHKLDPSRLISKKAAKDFFTANATNSKPTTITTLAGRVEKIEEYLALTKRKTTDQK